MAIGKKTGGGSRKGIPNKATKELKDMIQGALDAKGGQKWLEQQMDESPAAFMTLLGKILPKDVKTEITGKNGGPIEQKTSVAIDSTKEWLNDTISRINAANRQTD